MKKAISILAIISVGMSLISCKTFYDKRTYIESFKLDVTNYCLSEGMQSKAYDSIVFQNDASFTYDGLIGPNYYKIDSIGRSEGRKIPRTPIEDLEKKKLIHSHCLQYYKSKELHILAKKYYRNKL